MRFIPLAWITDDNEAEVLILCARRDDPKQLIAVSAIGGLVRINHASARCVDTKLSHFLEKVLAQLSVLKYQLKPQMGLMATNKTVKGKPRRKANAPAEGSDTRASRIEAENEKRASVQL